MYLCAYDVLMYELYEWYALEPAQRQRKSLVTMYLEFAWQQQLKLNLVRFAVDFVFLQQIQFRTQSVWVECVSPAGARNALHLLFSILLFSALELNELNLLLVLIYKLFR